MTWSLRLLSRLFVIILMPTPLSAFPDPGGKSLLFIDTLGIEVEPSENRQFSYTDKEAAYYYGRTHSNDDDDWFYGWNVNRQRIFNDYSLSVDGKRLQRSQALVTVYPHKLVRIYPNATETFMMFDEKSVLSISLNDVDGEKIGFSLQGEDLVVVGAQDGVALQTLSDQPNFVVVVAPMRQGSHDTEPSTVQGRVVADASAGGFFVVAAGSRAAAFTLLAEARRDHQRWASERKNRMNSLVLSIDLFRSDYETLSEALPWITLTLDQLITRQTGYGIYAGLPWFNDYWGRDTFIALPGACLVTGQFDTARKILRSFAEFQNTDRKSSHYGRVPNRVRPDDVIYNTTDGTPRFIIALLDYIKYSGDLSLVHELYPVIRRSIEGPIQHWVDDAGYLMHDDADTWMDAKLEGTVPWSPRGNRANDIQALWYRQLLAGVYFADLLNEVEDAERWKDLADRLQANFLCDFLDTAQSRFMADRLLPDGTRDFTVRPNQLFALDLIPDEPTRWRITRSVWEELVYPWGVTSLSQHDANFHPYHENWDCYHKDAAYHNGTVWIWNNGIAMQRMLEADQTESAYELFDTMSRMALTDGAIGSLCENFDALPHRGSSWPKRSGTFLQAWSNAEYLRVWYQHFLGIRPDALENELTIAPHMPEALGELSYRVRLFNGNLESEYQATGSTKHYSFVFNEVAPTVTFKLSVFEPILVTVAPGERLLATVTRDSLRVELWDVDSEKTFDRTVAADPRMLQRLTSLEAAFQGVKFATPYLQPNLKSLQKKQETGVQ